MAILREDERVRLELNGVEAFYLMSAITHMITKRQRELARSTFKPQPGRRHSQEIQIEYLTSTKRKLRRGLKNREKIDVGDGQYNGFEVELHLED